MPQSITTMATRPTGHVDNVTSLRCYISTFYSALGEDLTVTILTPMAPVRTVRSR